MPIATHPGMAQAAAGTSVAGRDPGMRAADIHERCRKHLAGDKQPKKVRFVALADLPRSTSGKIQRHALEARLLAG